MRLSQVLGNVAHAQLLQRLLTATLAIAINLTLLDATDAIYPVARAVASFVDHPGYKEAVKALPSETTEMIVGLVDKVGPHADEGQYDLWLVQE